MQLPEKYKENFDVSSEGPSSGVTRNVEILLRPKKIYGVSGFPTLPGLAFGCRNPNPKLFYWIMLCGKLKFEAILWKFIFGCGSTD
jgi:hypothetical protein